MIGIHEAAVARRFDELCGRFKGAMTREDYRLRAIVTGLSPLEGRRVLDLGCGKGRYCRALSALGASVVGVDLSAGMLANAAGVQRVRATARRLPFGPASFDRVMAVEVFEHLAPQVLDLVCAEARRVLRPGGTFVIIDKSACSCDSRRPWLPSLAVKWIDQRRGLWMYPHRGPVRERWFRPGRLKRRLGRWFGDVRIVHLLSPSEEGRFPFQQIPPARLFVLLSARVPGRAA
jgi:2-polyprenyl-6-hydroxyphenyl methylase/3-demethylubiquinone-9 3-methyltransferase